MSYRLLISWSKAPCAVAFRTRPCRGWLKLGASAANQVKHILLFSRCAPLPVKHNTGGNTGGSLDALFLTHPSILLVVYAVTPFRRAQPRHRPQHIIPIFSLFCTRRSGLGPGCELGLLLLPAAAGEWCDRPREHSNRRSTRYLFEPRSLFEREGERRRHA